MSVSQTYYANLISLSRCLSTFADIMAGIYLHIPFCKKACHYCDFHFSTSLQYKDELLNAMMRELETQQSYLGRESIETIYFGGGTPSLIGADLIQSFIDKIDALHSINPEAEITLEANPDDLNNESVRALRSTQVNRFSIGIQSFFQDDLVWMNRAHNAEEAESSIKRVQDAGFENITADLIYGYPLLSDQKWKANIQNIIDLSIPHVSAYSMTVEPRTALAAFISKGKQAVMNESQSADQYTMLIESLNEAGFEHYETSNFAKPDCYSRHNTNYWRGVKYLGIGPSAHSYNGDTRQWNIANNHKYIQGILIGELPAEVEELSIENRINEYIMTSLRTMWGLDLGIIEREFGSDYSRSINKSAREALEKNQLTADEDFLKLTNQGKLFADHIASQLFITKK